MDEKADLMELNCHRFAHGAESLRTLVAIAAVPRGSFRSSTGEICQKC